MEKTKSIFHRKLFGSILGKVSWSKLMILIAFLEDYSYIFDGKMSGFGVWECKQLISGLDRGHVDSY